MNATSELDPKEKVGRGIFSGSQLGRLNAASEEGEAPPDYILGRRGEARISVDLLRGTAQVMTAIGIANALLRGQDRNFHGWIEFTVRVAEDKGRRVVPSPREKPPANPYHADIVLPCAVSPDADNFFVAVMMERAALLADLAGNFQIRKPFGSQKEEDKNDA